MWLEHSELCAATIMPMEPSTRDSSSTAMTYSTYPEPAPPYSCGKMMPINPSLPNSLMVCSGNSDFSSHSITCGLISRSANSRTDFLRASCSSFSWKSTRSSKDVCRSRTRIPEVGKTGDYTGIVRTNFRCLAQSPRRWLGELLHHNIHQLTQNDDHLHGFFADDRGFDFVVCQRL